MALEALGWLGGKLGVSFAAKKDEQAPPPSSGIEQAFSQLNDKVFGGDQAPDQERSAAPAASAEQQDVVELDEYGLPKGRDWYFYNDEKRHWDVRPHAPEWVKREHAMKLAEEERARNEPKKFPAPPPPPMLSVNAAQFSGGARSPLTPQYAVPTFFQPTAGAENVSTLPQGAVGSQGVSNATAFVPPPPPPPFMPGPPS